MSKATDKVSTAQKKREFKRITRIAKEFETLLEQYIDWKSVVEVIRELITKNIEDSEYLLLCDLDAFALVHSNRLREGICFNDEVGLKGARSTVPIAQIYHRNTGETLLDVACPVYIKGKHAFYIRLAIAIHTSKLARQIFLGVLPIFVLGFGLVVYSSFSPVVIVFAVILVGLQTVYAYVFNKKLSQGLDEGFKVTKAVANGDLRVLAKAHTEDELGTLAYEVNKLSMGIKLIITELETVANQSYDISQSQAEHTNSLAERFQNLGALLEEFSAGATEQILGMQNAQDELQGIEVASQNIKKSTEDVLALATSAKSTSQEGKMAVKEAVVEMGLILHVTEQANHSIKSLSEQAVKIGNIVAVINGISAQTNLLSLNAAIEAARAGEHGRGFSVVAEEIRNLADHSAQSSKQIIELIAGVQKLVQEAVKNMDLGMIEVEKGKGIIEKAGQAINVLGEVVYSTADKIEDNLQNANQLLEQTQALVKVQNSSTAVSHQFASTAQQAAATVVEQTDSTQKVARMAAELANTSSHLNMVLKRFIIR